MLKDYYRILGVPRNAPIEDIKSAYRRRALECHPDRGGSHTAMLEINEAFEILSDLEKRRLYDEAFGKSGRLRLADVEQFVHEAQQNAANYPRRWSDFETWLNSLTADFHRATYGRTKDGIPLPTAGASVTGWIFIFAGVALGYWVFTLISGTSVRALLFCGAGGAWLGRIVHEGVAQSLREKK